ncbi:MAG: SurA N-terminal domain-containing protein [Coriobacteriia bacterium]|nr:SurA N-terminal domain-containing protein [Coriobacteriia bacterium]
MRKRVFNLRTGMAVLVATCLAAFALTGCDGTKGTAATIMGEEISEEAVTEYIQTYRTGVQCADDAAWADYLAQKQLTPEDLRNTTIYELAAPVVVKKKAEELGLTVQEDEVDRQIEAMKASLVVEDDESWQNELKRYGTSEEKLRENYANKNLQSQVYDKLVEGMEATDKDMTNYMQDFLVGTTAKKIECLYSDGYTYAQDLLDTIEAGSTPAAGWEAAKKKADEKNSFLAKLGWDLNAELTQNMVGEIAKLEKGQASTSLLSEAGTYYLFYVVDTYTFPEKAPKPSSLDKDLKKAVGDLAVVNLTSSAGGVWLQQQIQENITINPMPKGLPYDVEVPAASKEDQKQDEAKDEEKK